MSAVRLRESAPDVDVEGRLAQGSAAKALVEGSAGAELLVVGSRGLGGFRELQLGCVSHECAQHASCPLLIVLAMASALGVPLKGRSVSRQHEAPPRQAFGSVGP
jgi:hypothetical protein